MPETKNPARWPGLDEACELRTSLNVTDLYPLNLMAARVQRCHSEIGITNIRDVLKTAKRDSESMAFDQILLEAEQEAAA